MNDCNCGSCAASKWHGHQGLYECTELKKPKPIFAEDISVPAFTQEMADSGCQLECGMRFSTECGEYIAVYTNKKSICFTDENGFLVSINRGYAKPIPVPIQLIDGAAYMFNYQGSDFIGLYEDDEKILFMVGCTYNLENCSSIRHMTVAESK